MVDNMLTVEPIQNTNAVVIDDQIKLIENYTDVTMITDTNITLLLAIIFALLILISSFNWTLNLTRISDKS